MSRSRAANYPPKAVVDTWGQVPTETRYAQNGEASLAWTTRRRGADRTCCSCPGSSPTSSTCGTTPGWPASSSGCAAFARVILMDRRGTGLSDPLDGALHAGGRGRRRPRGASTPPAATRAVLLGYLTGGPLAIKFAAEPPGARARARALRRRRALAVGAGLRLGQRRRRALGRASTAWSSAGARARCSTRSRPSRAGDARLRAWLARLERLSSSPGELRRAARSATDFDVRAELCRPPRADADPAPHGRPPDRRAPLALHRRAHPRRAATSSSRASTTCRASATAPRCSARSRSSSPAAARGTARARAADDPLQRHRRLDRPRRPARRRRLARPARGPRRGRPPRGRPLRRPRGQGDRRRVPRRRSPARRRTRCAAPRRSCTASSRSG